MLTIIVVNLPYVFANNVRITERHVLNQIEFLRKSDRKNRSLYILPYAERDFFREEFIQDMLDKDSFIDKTKIGQVWWSNGVTYRIFVEKL